MKTFLIAAVAVAVSGAAFAKDLKQQQTTAPTVKAQTMSDAEMDQVTAGAIVIGGAYDVSILSGGNSNNGLNGPAPPPISALRGLDTAVCASGHAC